MDERKGDEDTPRMGSKDMLARMRERLSRYVGNQSAIARATGINQTAISKILAGSQRPFADQLYVIARECGTTVDDLFSSEPMIEESSVPDYTEGLTAGEVRIIDMLRLLDIDPDSAIRVLASAVRSGEVFKSAPPPEFPVEGFKAVHHGSVNPAPHKHRDR